jgi:hypothetical protein
MRPAGTVATGQREAVLFSDEPPEASFGGGLFRRSDTLFWPGAGGDSEVGTGVSLRSATTPSPSGLPSRKL